MIRSGMIHADPAACTACRACELACHFHHTGTFGTSRSSLCIRYDPATAALEIKLDPSCDQCTGEPHLRCVAACVPGALTIV